MSIIVKVSTILNDHFTSQPKQWKEPWRPRLSGCFKIITLAITHQQYVDDNFEAKRGFWRKWRPNPDTIYFSLSIRQVSFDNMKGVFQLYALDGAALLSVMFSHISVDSIVVFAQTTPNARPLLSVGFTDQIKWFSSLISSAADTWCKSHECHVYIT